jgi:hypothetical protein
VEDYDISADGSVIVGEATRSFTEGPPYDPGGREAIIWDEAYGMRELRDVLVDLGVDVSASSSYATYATSVSADGLTIVGHAFHEGVGYPWIATIPEPSSLLLLGAAAIIGARRRRRGKTGGDRTAKYKTRSFEHAVALLAGGVLASHAHAASGDIH